MDATRTLPRTHLFRILPPFIHPKPEEPELPELLRALAIQAVTTPDTDSNPAIVAADYDFDNEPEYLWEAYVASPSQRTPVDSPIRMILARSWRQPTEDEDGVTGPPQTLGMEFRMADGSSCAINFPTTFKEALATSPSRYRDFPNAEQTPSVLVLLTSMQKGVLSDTLASMRYFCDDTAEARRCWPHFRKLLFDLAQFGGEDGIPGERLFKILRDWVLNHIRPETGRGPLRFFKWD